MGEAFNGAKLSILLQNAGSSTGFVGNNITLSRDDMTAFVGCLEEHTIGHSLGRRRISQLLRQFQSKFSGSTGATAGKNVSIFDNVLVIDVLEEVYRIQGEAGGMSAYLRGRPSWTGMR